jgi:hypothetical protein
MRNRMETFGGMCKLRFADNLRVQETCIVSKCNSTFFLGPTIRIAIEIGVVLRRIRRTLGQIWNGYYCSVRLNRTRE